MQVPLIAETHGLPRGLQLAEQPGHAADVVEQELYRLLAVLRLLGLEKVEHAAQHGEIGAAGERLLAGGDDGALDGRVGGDLVDDLVELLDARSSSKTFIDLSGMSQVTRAMPSASVSRVKFL